MEPDRSMRSLARSQHGVVGDRQTSQAGVDRRRRASRIDTGAMEPAGDRVFVLAGAPFTDRARAMAAVLDVRGDSYLSHTSAAWLWGVPGFELDPIHVARRFEGTRRPSSLAMVHNLRGVPAVHLGQLDGIPVASPALACFQVAAVASLGRTERAVDNVLAMGLTRIVILHRLLGHLAQRGRNGITNMRSILESRPPGYRPPESGNERRFQWLADQSGIRVRPQVDIGTDDQFVTRVDFADLDFPGIVYRIQSARWHSAVSHARDDLHQLELLADRFTVVDIWDKDLWQHPSRVMATIRQARYDRSVGRNRQQS